MFSIKFRLIAAFTFSVIFGNAYADNYPFTVEYYITSSSNRFPTVQTACDDALTYYNGASNSLVSAPTSSGYKCNIYNLSGALIQSKSIVTFDSCPYGGSQGLYNGVSQCINAPSCPAGETRNAITGACESLVACPDGSYASSVELCPAFCEPNLYAPTLPECPAPPDCTNEQTPVESPCRYPEDKGTGINCSDGSTVYVPMVCPVSPWDDKMPPKEGEQKTCSDGRVIGYPQTCFEVFKNHAVDMFGTDKAIAIVLNTMTSGLSNANEAVRLIDKAMNGSPELWANAPFAVRVAENGAAAFSHVETAVPDIAMGQALSDYIKSSPVSPYVQSLQSVTRNGVTPFELHVNPNTGAVYPHTSTVPLTSNQLVQLAKAAHHIAPMPLTEIAPYVPYPLIPWYEPAIDALDGDVKRVFDPAGQKSPYNFPQLSPTKFSPTIPTITNPPTPLVTLGPNSPLSYPKPAPSQPSELPSPLSNPNPTGTDGQTSLIPSPDPNTPLDPAAADVPPVPPEVYPDTWKFFDFMPMANPFSFDVHDFIPQLPEPTCYYEIHRTFHVPFLGNKTFDLAPCVPLQPLRTVLAWVFSVLTLFTCFFVIFRDSV